MTRSFSSVGTQDPNWERWVRWCNADQPASSTASLVDSLRVLSQRSEFDRPIVAIHHSTSEFEAAGYVVIYPGAFGVIGNWRFCDTRKDGTALPKSYDLEVAVTSSILSDLCRIASGQGAEVVQVILPLDPDHALLSREKETSIELGTRERSLAESGMTAIASLVQMQLDLDAYVTSIEEQATGADNALPFKVVPWNSLEKSKAYALVEQTYVDTLDVPELNGVRSTARTLQGYAHQAKDAERNWWTMERDANLIGCLMLTEMSSMSPPKTWELTYFGLIPAVRGQGLASHILKYAMKSARDGGANSMLLAVDIRNAPAIHLYQKFGFTPTQFVQAWVASG